MFVFVAIKVIMKKGAICTHIRHTHMEHQNRMLTTFILKLSHYTLAIVQLKQHKKELVTKWIARILYVQLGYAQQPFLFEELPKSTV